jgi:hypothetical protein
LSELPQMSFRRMFQLALRTWPFMRPMLKHLWVLAVAALAGGLTLLVSAFVGTDLLTNKVLLGEKLQPIQAAVLFVGDEFVTTDPEKLGKSANKKVSKGLKSKGKSAAGKSLVSGANQTPGSSTRRPILQSSALLQIEQLDGIVAKYSSLSLRREARYGFTN